MVSTWQAGLWGTSNRHVRCLWDPVYGRGHNTIIRHILWSLPSCMPWSYGPREHSIDNSAEREWYGGRSCYLMYTVVRSRYSLHWQETLLLHVSQSCFLSLYCKRTNSLNFTLNGCSGMLAQVALLCIEQILAYAKQAAVRRNSTVPQDKIA